MVSLDPTADHGAHPHLTLIMVPSSLVQGTTSTAFFEKQNMSELMSVYL